MPSPIPFNPELDLQVERTGPARVEQVWRALTTPDRLMKWFCPAPWRVSACELDLQPGGTFKVAMAGPDGQSFDGPAGCILEVSPNERVVWTSFLGPGFRPLSADPEGFGMTASYTLSATAEGTRIHAQVLHATSEDRAKHDAMGFDAGWGVSLEQLLAEALAG